MTDDTKDIVEQAKAEAEKGDLVSQHRKDGPKQEDDTPPIAEGEPISDEERDELSRHVQQVIMKHMGIRQCLGSMIAARQLYAMCVRELESQVAELPEEDQHELLEECLVQSAGHQAAKPFNENALYVGFQQTVYPWMVRTVEKHNKEDEAEHQKDMEEAEQIRRDRPIPVGIKFDPDLEALPRERTLVLVGWAPAVDYVIQEMVTKTLANKDGQLFSVIWLTMSAHKLGTQPQLWRYGGEDWKHCCKVNKTWPKFFQTKILRDLDAPPDLLVCDDLMNACEQVIGTRTVRSAGAAHKRFRQWCVKAGCGFLGGVPQDTKEPPKLQGAEWEQLRTWSILRPVWVREASSGDDYALYIGKDLFVDNIPKATLDSRQKTKLVLPGS